MVYNKLIGLCIRGWKKEAIDYLTSDNTDVQIIKDTFAYIMVNNMEKFFLVIIQYIVNKIDIYSSELQNEYFEYACIGGNISIINWFLLNGYNINDLVGCLSATTYNEHVEATKFLIVNGANTYAHINCDNCFAFLNVIRIGNDELIKLFIINGVNIELAIITVIKEYKKKYQKGVIDKINYYWNKYKL